MTRRSRIPPALLGGSVVALALTLALLIYQAFSGGVPLLSVAATPTQPDTSLDWLQVYFSQPDNPASSTLRGGPDAALAAAINAARLTVDAALYDLDLWSVRDALLDAHRRGVAVRVVAESDNLDSPELQDLAEAGIPVLGDRREGLMHDKFVVIDRLEVWTGSMNFTLNGAYRNDNNLIHIRSSSLARRYLDEFDEMFVADRFGPDSPPGGTSPSLTVEGVPLEVYFSPENGTAARLVTLIQQAQESVYFLVYSFTADDIAGALIDQARAGVTVAGVLEARQVDSNQGTEYGRLRSAGLDVHLDGNPANMHHKVLIIDRSIVITGSYNFSASAERRNDENTLVIHSPQVAALYLVEFERLYEAAGP